MGAMLIIALSASFRADYMTTLLRSFMLLALMSSAFIVVAVVAALMGAPSLEFATPLRGLGGVIGEGNGVLVDYSVRVRLLFPDYFASTAVPRLNLYSPYPTAGAGVLMIILAMSYTWASVRQEARPIWFWPVFGTTVLGFGMTLSRMSIVAFLTCCVFMWLMERDLLWLSIVGALLLSAVMLPLMQGSLEYVLLAREGSTTSRFELYLHSVSQVRGVDWLVGLGIRPRPGGGFPTGSHSTYISLLYRSGLFGLVGFLTFQAILIGRWYLLRAITRTDRQTFVIWRGFGVVFLSMAFWMLTEDIDAPQLLAFIYFSCIGLFEGFRRVVLENRPQMVPLLR